MNGFFVALFQRKPGAAGQQKDGPQKEHLSLLGKRTHTGDGGKRSAEGTGSASVPFEKGDGVESAKKRRKRAQKEGGAKEKVSTAFGKKGKKKVPITMR